MYSTFSIPTRSLRLLRSTTNKKYPYGYFLFVVLLVGIEPTFLPSQGSVLSIERQEREQHSITLFRFYKFFN